MKAIRALTLAAAILATVAAGAGSRAQAQRDAANQSCALSMPEASGSTALLAGATRTFGFRLFDTLSSSRQQGNVFISPVSVELALAMAYDGARGSTQQAMAQSLRLHGMTPATLRRQAAALLTTLQSADPAARLEIADSLWARAGVSFKQQFLQDITRDFDARAATLNFDSPGAASTINSWVSCATHGTIPSIVSRIPPEMVLYLINAVYFDGQWTTQFNPAQTRDRTFTTGSGRKIQVPLMNQTGTFSYYAGSNVQVISLPYSHGRFAMMVVLPRTGTSLAALRRQMTAGQFSGWIAHSQPLYGEIGLPRFTISNDFSLNGALRSLGMGKAFDGVQANFQGMCEQRCFLSEVRHRTYLKVYEKGTVAAGVTSVGVGATAVRVPQFQMIVDHPFALAVRDTTTGTLLFLGGINNPAG